jgi:hypothetical protein
MGSKLAVLISNNFITFNFLCATDFLVFSAMESLKVRPFVLKQLNSANLFLKHVTKLENHLYRMIQALSLSQAEGRDHTQALGRREGTVYFKLALQPKKKNTPISNKTIVRYVFSDVSERKSQTSESKHSFTMPFWGSLLVSLSRYL